MNSRRASILAWSIVTAGGTLAIAGVLAEALSPPVAVATLFTDSLGVALFVAWAILGGLVASRQPENLIGWIFCAFLGFAGVAGLAAGYAEVAPADATRGAGLAAAWFSNWSYPLFFALVIFILLTFPDGHLLSRRWRLAGWSAAVGTAAQAAGTAFEPGRLHDYPKVVNPVALDHSVATALGVGGVVLTMCSLAAAAVSVVVRYRRSRAVARQQIKWLAVAAAFCAVAFLVAGTMAGTGHETAGNVLIELGVLGIPIAVGIAMLRYRLYEIDRIISRTLVYGALTALLGAAYAGLVIGGQALFASFAGGSNLAIAVSTLVVAALFLPARSRVQRFVDRRFYRRRYDAQRTLDAFGTRLREQVELEALTADLRAIVRETMQPVDVSVWLREARR